MLLHTCIDFYMNILYIFCQICTNLLIPGGFFLFFFFSQFSGISLCKQVICEKQFYFYFPICITFVFCLVLAQARTSNTLVYKSGERKHPCIVPSLGGRTPNFTPLSKIVAVGILQKFITKLRTFSFILSQLKIFIMERCGIFAKCFLCQFGICLFYQHVHVMEH